MDELSRKTGSGNGSEAVPPLKFATARKNPFSLQWWMTDSQLLKSANEDLGMAITALDE